MSVKGIAIIIFNLSYSTHHLWKKVPKKYHKTFTMIMPWRPKCAMVQYNIVAAYILLFCSRIFGGQSTYGTRSTYLYTLVVQHEHTVRVYSVPKLQHCAWRYVRPWYRKRWFLAKTDRRVCCYVSVMHQNCKLLKQQKQQQQQLTTYLEVSKSFPSFHNSMVFIPQ